MNCKNCLNKLMWLAGALLVVSFVFPNGFESFGTKPVVDEAVVVGETDAAIVKALADATPEDRAHIAGIYNGLTTVLKRDSAKPPLRITTTEQWADLQANTLQLAIETPGVYPGLDTAIEAVFKRVMGTDDVVSVTADVNQKLITACETIANSTQPQK
jgi:hypothetical protein